MKNIKLSPVIFSLAVLFTLLATACTKQDKNEIITVKESPLSLFKTVDDVKALELDAKFSLSSDVYSEFLNSLKFKDMQLRGFYYADVIKNMSKPEQKEFWAYFNITVQPNEDVAPESGAVSREVNPPVLGGEICTAFDAYPLYCWYSPGWACLYIC